MEGETTNELTQLVQHDHANKNVDYLDMFDTLSIHSDHSNNSNDTSSMWSDGGTQIKKSIAGGLAGWLVSILYVIGAACVQLLMENIPIWELNSVCFLTVIPVLMIWVYWKGEKMVPDECWTLFCLVIDSCLQCYMSYFFYTAVQFVPLGNGQCLLTTVSLIVIAIGARLFLGETMFPGRFFAIIITIIGLVLVLQPNIQFLTTLTTSNGLHCLNNDSTLILNPNENASQLVNVSINLKNDSSEELVLSFIPTEFNLSSNSSSILPKLMTAELELQNAQHGGCENMTHGACLLATDMSSNITNGKDNAVLFDITSSEMKGYIFLTIAAVLISSKMIISRKHLVASVPLAVQLLWNYIISSVISIIVACSTEEWTLPASSNSGIYLLIICISGFVLSLYTHATYRYAYLPKSTLDSAAIKWSFVLQYTLLSSLHGGHFNTKEIIGAIIVLAGSVTPILCNVRFACQMNEMD